MGCHLVRSLCFAAVSALALQGCDKPTPPASGRSSSHPVIGRAAATDAQQSLADTLHGIPSATDRIVAGAPSGQRSEDDPQPWLAELLHSPDPNVRVQGLDAWARQPTTSLDPLTYALVDPDETVRARAQALFEEALARRGANQ
jgi:hypothetical protein